MRTERLDQADTTDTLSFADQFVKELNDAQAAILKEFQQWLEGLEGTCLSSAKDNEILARNIGQIARRLGCSLVCPKCGKPGSFDYSISKPERPLPSGVFRFRHRDDGKTIRHSLKNQMPKIALMLTRT